MPRLIRRWTLYILLAVGIVFWLQGLAVKDLVELTEDAWQGPPPPPPKAGPSRDAYFKWRDLRIHFPVVNLTRLPDGPAKKIPKLQHDFSVYKEDSERATERKKRLEAVKEAFEHSWEGYKKHAWLHDEVRPISGKPYNPFGGWGTTYIDTLDTLWLMGMETEFAAAVSSLKQTDFTGSSLDNINLFETTVKYLGGLLGAYDLCNGKHPALLNKAIELGNMLYHAFDTNNHMPISHWPWRIAENGWQTQIIGEKASLAELASLSLEFTRLAQLTFDHKYFDAVHRISELLYKDQNSTRLPGLWPSTLDPAKEDFHSETTFTLGSMGGAAYETLPKQYLLLGGRMDIYKDMYFHATAAAKEYLMFEPLIPLQNAKGGPKDKQKPKLVPAKGPPPPERIRRRDESSAQELEYRDARPLENIMPAVSSSLSKRASGYQFSPDYINPLVLGSASVPGNDSVRDSIDFSPKVEQVSCSAGGTFALGARALAPLQTRSKNGEDTSTAERLTAGCVWSYKNMVTGIGPETWTMSPCRRGRAAIASGGEKDWQGTKGNCRWERAEWVGAVRSHRLKDSDEPVEGESEDTDRWERLIDDERLNEGFTNIADRRYLLRPETIESVFYMWRTTGDPKWQDTAWDMFVAVANLTRTKVAYASLADVTIDLSAPEPPPRPAPPPPSSKTNPKTSKKPPTTVHDSAPASPSHASSPSSSYKRTKRAVSDFRESVVNNIAPHLNSLTKYVLPSHRKTTKSTSQSKTSDDDTKGTVPSEATTRRPPELLDSMESHWTAETLKYFYLIFSDPDVMSLDEFVLNTAAHPLRWRRAKDVPPPPEDEEFLDTISEPQQKVVGKKKKKMKWRPAIGMKEDVREDDEE